jgi:hypothetical protein
VPEYSEEPRDEELVLVKAARSSSPPLPQHAEEEDTVALLSSAGQNFSRQSIDLSSGEGAVDGVFMREASPPPYMVMGTRSRSATFGSDLSPQRSRMSGGFEDVELGPIDSNTTTAAGRVISRGGHSVTQSLDTIPRLDSDLTTTTSRSSSRLDLSAGLRTVFQHARGSSSSSSLLPTHLIHARNASSGSRITTRDISAPLSDTLVRSAYV